VAHRTDDMPPPEAYCGALSIRKCLQFSGRLADLSSARVARPVSKRGVRGLRPPRPGAEHLIVRPPVEHRVYTDVNTAYTDVVAGNLDVLRRIPADVSATAPAEFGERYLEDTSSSFTYLGLPLYDAGAGLDA
jgi:hypothetical protein